MLRPGGGCCVGVASLWELSGPFLQYCHDLKLLLKKKEDLKKQKQLGEVTSQCSTTRNWRSQLLTRHPNSTVCCHDPMKTPGAGGRTKKKKKILNLPEFGPKMTMIYTRANLMSWPGIMRSSFLPQNRNKRVKIRIELSYRKTYVSCPIPAWGTQICTYHTSLSFWCADPSEPNHRLLSSGGERAHTQQRSLRARRWGGWALNSAFPWWASVEGGAIK